MLSTTRWQPFTGTPDLKRWHDEMNRVFDRVWGNGSRGVARSAYPPLNLWEDDETSYVEAELPGFELSDLEIFVNGDNHLTIKGERKPPAVENGTWHRQERGFGSFSRSLELPYAVDEDKVSAELKNGVLLISMPKREEVKPRRIEVKAS